MSQVAIEKINEKQIATASVFEEVNALTERIRQRAFGIFEGRHGVSGLASEDWLSAERELLSNCESELIEQGGAFQIRMNAAGFEPGDVKVTALPDAVIVRAESSHTHNKKEGNVRFCEFGQKTLFRRIDLPESINIDKVTANLKNGLLLLTAAKAKSEAAPKGKAVTA